MTTIRLTILDDFTRLAMLVPAAFKPWVSAGRPAVVRRSAMKSAPIWSTLQEVSFPPDVA